MHYKPLFDIGYCYSKSEAYFGVPVSSLEKIDKHREELAKMCESLAKSLRDNKPPFEVERIMGGSDE
jgi:hypothetical protein